MACLHSIVLCHHFLALNLLLSPVVHLGLRPFPLLFIVYNQLLSPQIINITAYYRAKISDYLLLSLKNSDLTANNRKKLRFFAISI